MDLFLTTFSPEEEIASQFEVKNIFKMDLFLRNMQLFCLLVDYCDAFIRWIWTLILTAPIHCRGSIDEQVV